jgi:hypothetical protein
LDPLEQLLQDVAPEDLVRLLIQRMFKLEARVIQLEDTLKRIQRERGAR